MKELRNNKLKLVYENYAIASDKLNHNYYKEKRYKQFVDYLYANLATPNKALLQEYVVYLESLSVPDFILLCDLAEKDMLQGLTLLIEVIGRMQTWNNL